jgi:hypothetical protein
MESDETDASMMCFEALKMNPKLSFKMSPDPCCRVYSWVISVSDREVSTSCRVVGYAILVMPHAYRLPVAVSTRPDNPAHKTFVVSYSPMITSNASARSYS